MDVVSDGLVVDKVEDDAGVGSAISVDEAEAGEVVVGDGELKELVEPASCLLSSDVFFAAFVSLDMSEVCPTKVDNSVASSTPSETSIEGLLLLHIRMSGAF